MNRTDVDIPAALHAVDYVRICFLLEFLEECSLDIRVFLGLRGLLRSMARQVCKGSGPDGMRRYRLLFEPETSHDPVALKKFQKPSPPFVFQLKPFVSRTFVAGERFELEVLLLGNSIPLVGDFWACLRSLGNFGLVDGRGKFKVVGISAAGEDGKTQQVWRSNVRFDQIAPPIATIGSWLECQALPGEDLIMNFAIPTRLMAGGRPLRQPTFAQVFPFMLRRVTSMLHAHADCEPVQDVNALMKAAAAVSVSTRSFQWHDWKDLGGNRQVDTIGGFTGHCHLTGETLGEILWVIAVASLFGIGKGAAYGAGRFSFTGVPCERDPRT
jgi:hypothetical protein